MQLVNFDLNNMSEIYSQKIIVYAKKLSLLRKGVRYDASYNYFNNILLKLLAR